METVVDLAESRKARSEKNQQLRQAANDLLTLLEQQREEISEEFMSFLLAMAISDQAMFYAEKTQQWQAGERFIENLVTTTHQLFDTHGPLNQTFAPNKSRKAAPTTEGCVLPLLSFKSPQSD
jgi:hypothetical protein